MFNKIKRQFVFAKPQDVNFTPPGFILSNNSSFAKRPTILILDSGVGGLSIYDEVRKILPNAHYLYVFDNEMFPYGEKSEQLIVNRVVDIVNRIWQLHKLNMIIVACNTASIISLPKLRERFSCPIIGTVPAIKLAAKLTRNGIIGLLATRATIQNSYTQDLIDRFTNNCQILQLGTAELVDIAEAKLHGEIVPFSILHKLFHPWLKVVNPPDTVVLGCTHFPLLSSELQLILSKKIRLVDSGSAIARRVAWLAEHVINIDGLKKETETNKAYCLTITPQVIALMPILTSYGFGSLGKLTL